MGSNPTLSANLRKILDKKSIDEITRFVKEAFELKDKKKKLIIFLESRI